MTIKDLARETGYSVGTVSRVLNDQPNVSEKAKRVILDCAERSGFQLNSNAKHLKQQRGDGVLAVVTGTTNDLFAHMLVHIQQNLSRTQYPLSVDYVDEEEDAVLHALRQSRENKPLGILFLGGDARLFARSFGKISLPSVVLTADASELGFANLSSVTTDDTEAACCAISHLIDCGHREIGVICGDREVSGPSRLRYLGCQKAFREHGMDLPESSYATARYSYTDGYRAARQLLEQKAVTAIFAMSDIMAIGAIRALTDKGYRVPEDISVVGFDGVKIGEYYIPKLTTIRQNADLLAERAVQLLLDAVEKNTPARHEKVPFSLAVNDSVLRKEDENL